MLNFRPFLSIWLNFLSLCISAISHKQRNPTNISKSVVGIFISQCITSPHYLTPLPRVLYFLVSSLSMHLLVCPPPFAHVSAWPVHAIFFIFAGYSRAWAAGAEGKWRGSAKFDSPLIPPNRTELKPTASSSSSSLRGDRRTPRSLEG